MPTALDVKRSPTQAKLVCSHLHHTTLLSSFMNVHHFKADPLQSHLSPHLSPLPISFGQCPVPSYFRPQKTIEQQQRLPHFKASLSTSQFTFSRCWPRPQDCKYKQTQCASKTDYKSKKNEQSPASLPTLVPPDPGRKLFFSYNEVDFNLIISFITHLLSVIYYTVTSENIYLKSRYGIYA